MNIVLTKEAIQQIKREELESGKGIRIHARMGKGRGIVWTFTMEITKKKMDDKEYYANDVWFYMDDYTKDIIGNKLIIGYGKKTKYKIMNEHETLGYYLEMKKQ